MKFNGKKTKITLEVYKTVHCSVEPYQLSFYMTTLLLSLRPSEEKISY